MRIVHKGDEPLNFPGVCMFTRDAEGPWLDTDTYLNARELNGVDPYGYITVLKVEDMGRAVGMVPAHVHQTIVAERDALAKHAAELEVQLLAFKKVREAAAKLVAA